MIPVILAAAKSLIPWRALLVAGAVVVLALSLFTWGHVRGAAGIRAQWGQEKAQEGLRKAQEAQQALSAALQAQQALQVQIDQAQKDRKNETARIDRVYAAVVDSLRDRPQTRAAAGVPSAAEPGAGCTGAGLAGPDAGFLAGYAADAARTQAILDQCRAGYQAAKGRLDALAGETVNNPASIQATQ
jgi:hypothetical protein